MNIHTSKTSENRRRFLRQLALGGASLWSVSGLYAELLTLTPQQTQGPFYPNNIPLDKDNDLIYLNDHLTPALGTITYISGRVLDQSGQPVRGALVELWQTDAHGSYLHTQGSTAAGRDPNFQGFGQFLTGSAGGYRFRTIKAGLYQGRTRHLHFGITLPGRSRFTTQLYWDEIPRTAGGAPWGTTNANDSVLNSIANAAQRASVIKTFTPVAGSVAGEVETSWDIVMGLTPIEPTYPGGSLIIRGHPVAASVGGLMRFKVSIPAHAGYSYEVYGNPTLGELAWAALPFSLSATGAVDRHIHTATNDGTLDLFLETNAVKGFYHVSFRVPGANVGTP